jgi:hypothetical protein
MSVDPSLMSVESPPNSFFPLPPKKTPTKCENPSLIENAWESVIVTIDPSRKYNEIAVI